MENKYVTYKNLKIGQEIKGTRDGDCTCGFTAYVKDINSAFVTVEMWRKGGEEKKINSDVMFSVEMTEKEFNDKYRYKALDVIKNIQNKLYKDQIGYHEMWNSWLYGNPFEIASVCIKHDISIVGHCTDIVHKVNVFSGEELDIGVCAEYSDGERFWCHFSSKMIEDLLEMAKYNGLDTEAQEKKHE